MPKNSGIRPMCLPRLCLILPAGIDEADRRPPPAPFLPRSNDPSKHTVSALRRLCTAANNRTRRRRSRPCWCCFSSLPATGKKHSSSLFSDVPGVDKATTYDNPRVFSYAELYIGSNGFSDEELLGSGGFGRVYRAVLPSDDTIVAVKCVVNAGEHFEKTFAAELAAVAQLRHRNLVRLRGWCIHDDQLLLVYDYMPNSSLDRVLFSSSARASASLGWRRRERIIAGLAAALFYLHEQLDTQIIHRDVKTSNVMLDSGYNAKLGDFGLARWLEHDVASANSGEPELVSKVSSTSSDYRFRLSNTSKIGGTIGYLPPETFEKKRNTGALTAKSDVFSFGIVVLELATGRRAVDLSYPDEKIFLLDWIRRLNDEGKSTNAGDTRLPAGSYSVSDIRRIIHLGLLCSLHQPSSRPTMKWVMEILTGNYSGDLPPLPYFRSHPYNCISSSSSTTTATSATNTSSMGHTSTTFLTANNSTIYLTANNDDPETAAAPILCSPPRSPSSPRPSSLFPQVDTPREIPFDEIVSITNNFSERNIIAELDFGTGYVGHLSYNSYRRIRVLVKRLGMKTCPALRSRFTDELRNLARLRHRNLVQLRGWCTEQGEMLVVYDYPSSSTLLSRRLSTTKDAVLPWRRRYDILKSLASAILYLHEEWEEQVIHRNITSSAIFLDRDMNPRLGCFALAEFLTRNNNNHHHSSAQSVRGIFGYMAPEYMKTGAATKMADVYSFGVVVLEVLTGKTAVDFRTPGVLLVRRVVEEGSKESDLVDSRLDGEHNEEEVRRVVEIGMRCTMSEAEERPSMREIVSVLDGNEEVMKVWEQGRQRREEAVEWRRWNGAALGVIRSINSLGIH